MIVRDPVLFPEPPTETHNRVLLVRGMAPGKTAYSHLDMDTSLRSPSRHSVGETTGSVLQQCSHLIEKQIQMGFTLRSHYS